MMDAAGLVSLGSVWTVLILQDSYRRGFESGQDNVQLEVANIMLDSEIWAVGENE